MKRILSILFLAILLQSCNSDNKLEKKGFQVSEISEDEQGEKIVGLPIDSLKLETQPRNVLITKNPNHRLVPIFKVNYIHHKNKKTEFFVGSVGFHRTWDYEYEERKSKGGNNWNNNIIPGFSAAYGYNFVNVSHYNYSEKNQNEFFEKPVLIKTLYYPAFSKDTLNYQPVKRDFYMISVYDEDTNKDGFLNFKDLRRLYFFDINGKSQKALIPKNYSVMSSEYDSDNDFMYIFAKFDKNGNGQMEQEEPTHIFWIDLKNPENNGIQYKNK